MKLDSNAISALLFLGAVVAVGVLYFGTRVPSSRKRGKR